MKFKSILKFVGISTVIICLYVSFILNIEHFTISYNNKKQEYKNTYYKRDNSSDILSKIGYAINDYYSDVAQSNIDVIKSDKIIRNIINVEDNKFNKYISRMQKMERIRLLNDELIYMQEDTYELAFTLDTKNIAYRVYETKNSASLYNAELYIEAEKTRNENKDEIYKNVTTQLQELGIVEKFGFEPETLYIKYFYAKEEMREKYEGIYVIEDSKNHIKVEIELPTYEIKELQIGFEDYRTVD